MVQMKVTASVLIAAAAIAPAVAYGFEAEDSLVTFVFSNCLSFHLIDMCSDVVGRITNLPTLTPEVLISTCKLITITCS